jgi:glutamine cyclotransferase
MLLSGSTVHSLDELSCRILGSIPHRQESFTQGLLYHGGFLYESTGRYGDSTLKKIDPETGSILQKISLSSRYFGEGLAVEGKRLVQLTWIAEKAYIYSLDDFRIIDSYRYPGEGWGLTSGPDGFIMSNGSDKLWIMDFDHFRLVKSIPVTLRGRPLTGLNELEYIDGYVAANVLSSDHIYFIHLINGVVTKYLDLGELTRLQQRGRPESVLNGIAHDPATNRWYITGKNWTRIYILRLDPPHPQKNP